MSETEIIKPQVTADEAKEMILNLYGFKVTIIKELVTYDDKNFYVEFDESSDNNHLPSPPDACIFKVINRLDSKDSEVMEAQTQILLHLHQKGFSVPLPILTKEGGYTQVKEITSKDQEGNFITSKNVVRMLAYIPGKLMHQVPHTADLLYEWGQYVADITIALQGFHHPALSTRSFMWQMTKIPDVKKYLFAIKDEEKKKMCEDVLNEFEDKVTTQYETLRMGTIHGDLNEQNILVRLKAGFQNEYEVAGVIDVGDIHYSYCIFEISLTVMYCMLPAESLDTLEAGGHVLAGFLSKQELTDEEFGIFKTCMEGRLVQTLVGGAYNIILDPSNDYEPIDEKRGWEVLERLRSTSQQELYEIWRKVIKARGLHIRNFPCLS